MKVGIEWPADKALLLELAEGLARLKGQNVDDFIIDLVEAEVKEHIGHYQASSWIRERMENAGLKEKYFPKTEKEARLRDLQ